MDFSNILGQGEQGLPTLSTATATTIQPGMPTIPVTHAGLFKFGVSGILSLLGMYYLATGKRESDLQKMLMGGALTLAAMFFF